MAYISFQPSDFFNTTLYTGDGSTQSITGVGFQPDMNFVKSRAVQNWGCVDAVRGVGEAIHPNLTLAEGSAPDGLTAFNADGFSVGTDTTWNGSTVAYASYNWKAGTTTALSGGTITPTAQSINITSGIAIIKYTGNADGTDLTGCVRAQFDTTDVQHDGTAGTIYVYNWLRGVIQSLDYEPEDEVYAIRVALPSLITGGGVLLPQVIAEYFIYRFEFPKHVVDLVLYTDTENPTTISGTIPGYLPE